jgi:septum formation protein
MISVVSPNLALASQSPRRREMLAWLGLPFETLDGSVDETPLNGEDPRGHVLRVAEAKARAVGARLGGNFTLISADTVVIDDGAIVGKPVDQADAVRILERLSGREHLVDTGYIIYNLNTHNLVKGLCESRVRMRSFTSEEILDYVRSGDPLDKAGAYAIQNRDFHPVPEFTGCMANVMGLPLCHLKRELNQQGIVIMKELAEVCRDHLKYDCIISERIQNGEEVG